jgi:hypothetical protein
MQKEMSDAATKPGWSPAVGGVISAFIGGLFVAQAGGSDREMFLSIGFLLGAVGLLGIIVGGVALGIRIARD